MVLLVRHGVTPTTGKELPGRAAGLHLADSGREQAERVAAHIAATTAAAAPAGNGKKPRKRAVSPGIAAVYASPLERAQETATPIARALGLPVTTDDGLVELDIGDWTGLELRAAAKRPEWATIQRYPSGFRFPGGESFVDMQARIISTIDRLRATHPGETVVAVSHADPIRALIAHAMGTHLDLFQRVAISPASLTAIAYGADGPTVLTVNSTGALSAPAPA